MVTPADILALVNRLLDEQTEVADRSAVSRAYHAAFWHARRGATERIGPLDVPGFDAHREVARMVELWSPDAADRLNDLRRHRNIADYEESASFSRELATILVCSAGRVLAMR